VLSVEALINGLKSGHKFSTAKCQDNGLIKEGGASFFHNSSVHGKSVHVCVCKQMFNTFIVFMQLPYIKKKKKNQANTVYRQNIHNHLTVGFQFGTLKSPFLFLCKL